MAVIDTPEGGAINTDCIAFVSPVLKNEQTGGRYFAVGLTVGDMPLKFNYSRDELRKAQEEHTQFILTWKFSRKAK